MDEAHALAAAGAAAGTTVLAEVQTAGRGRNGRQWVSPRRGIWLTLVERPTDAAALDVLSLRVGLAAARALDQFTAEPIRLKWPNDLYVDGRKLAGTLVEARWRGEHADWVAIGLGVNMEPPDGELQAAALDAGSSRTDVLEVLMAELRGAASVAGALTRDELDEYEGRDMARGRTCSEPLRGRVVGIAPTGELLIELADSIVRVRAGSLVLD
jgi:BirA family biotin operon repressor/biotin-[acetyl-CoA-carboxylase] ligase